jgi:hypothetical protein
MVRAVPLREGAQLPVVAGGEPQLAGERQLGDEREILLLLGRQPEPGERDLGPSPKTDVHTT